MKDSEREKKSFLEMVKILTRDENPSVYETPNRVMVRTQKGDVIEDNYLVINPATKASVISTIKSDYLHMDSDDVVAKVDIFEDKNGYKVLERTTALYANGIVKVIRNEKGEVKREIKKELSEAQLSYYLSRVLERLEKNSRLFEKN